MSSESDTLSSPFSNLNFDKVGFLNENKTNREFLGQVIDTQLFAKFVTDRSDPASAPSEVVFFDESIIDKGHKKSFSLRSSTTANTPLLNDTSHIIKDTYVVPAPNTLGLESDKRVKYSSFPESLATENYGPARTETFLVEVGEKPHRASAALRSIYHHRNAVSPVEETEATPVQSFQHVISFINVIVDHIVLLAISEVQRKYIAEQSNELEKLKLQISASSNRSITPKPILGIENVQNREIGNADIISKKKPDIISYSNGVGKKFALVFRIKSVK